MKIKNYILILVLFVFLVLIYNGCLKKTINANKLYAKNLNHANRIDSNTYLQNNYSETHAVKSGIGYALLVSVENTDVEDFDSSVTQNGDKYRDNIEDLLKTFKIRNIEKLTSPKDKEFISSFKSTLDKLNNEDLCIIYFYGHGGQVPDKGDDEEDEYDETLVLKNRQFIDDEIYEILNSYKKTSRLVFIFEACNTGSSYKINGEVEETPIHTPLVDERADPTFDIIYIGATSDGNSVPSDAFNKNFIKIIEDKEPKTYLELHKELSKKMFRRYKIFPTMDISHASDAFINSKPFKTN